MALYVPCGRSTANCCSAPGPNGRSTTTGPNSTSSQPAGLGSTSQLAESSCFSSISRRTISAWVMTSVLVPSVSVSPGPIADGARPAKGAGAAAGPWVANDTWTLLFNGPVPPSSHASEASASSVTEAAMIRMGIVLLDLGGRRRPARGRAAQPNVNVGSAFVPVVIVVLKGLDGLLDVLLHEALVLAAFVAGRRVDQAPVERLEPGSQSDTNGQIGAGRGLRDHQRRREVLFLLDVEIGLVGERLTVERSLHPDALLDELGVCRPERGLFGRVLADLVNLELDFLVRARRDLNGHVLHGPGPQREIHQHRPDLELLAAGRLGGHIAISDFYGL